MRPVRKADNLTTFLYAVVMKSRNLNFLEPSGPLQACNGTDLPFFTSMLLSILFCLLKEQATLLGPKFSRCLGLANRRVFRKRSITVLVPSSKLQLILITFGSRGPTLSVSRKLNFSPYLPNIIAALHQTHMQL